MRYSLFLFPAIVMSVTALSSVNLAQAEGESAKVTEKKLEETVEKAEENQALEAAQVGEASYNIEDCRRRVDVADGVKNQDNNNADGSEVEPLDLDRCRALIK